MLASPFSTLRRFFSENMLQTSAALAFTTLLALVPLITLMMSLSATLPFVDILIQRFDNLMVQSLLPPGSGGIIAAHIEKFCTKARSLAAPGIAMLIVTAFLLLNTIERTFNQLWRVKPRPYWQRLRLYALVILVFPILLGAIALVTTYAVSVSLGFLNEPAWMSQQIHNALSVALLGLFFSFLYFAVPNAPVNKLAALMGGLFASVLFALMQKGFEIYLTHVGSFKSIYGAFSAVPIFLLWLYLSWALVLFGGLIAASVFPHSRR